MAYTYILFSESDQGWYIGQTTLTPNERLTMHNAGRVRSTKPRRPWLLAYFEEVSTRQLATKREWHLKHPKGCLEKVSITQLALQEKKNWPLQGPFEPRN